MLATKCNDTNLVTGCDVLFRQTNCTNQRNMIDWLGNQLILNELNLKTFIIDYRHVSQIDPGSR